MKCLSFATVVFLFAVCPAHVRAARLQTGADLLKFCQVVLENKPSNVAMVDGVGCIAYLKGMSETFDLWELFNERRKQNNPAPACVPKGLTGRDMAIVIVKFIKEHPAEMHHPMSDVALTAFMNAYPCTNTYR